MGVSLKGGCAGQEKVSDRAPGQQPLCIPQKGESVRLSRKENSSLLHVLQAGTKPSGPPFCHFPCAHGDKVIKINRKINREGQEELERCETGARSCGMFLPDANMLVKAGACPSPALSRPRTTQAAGHRSSLRTWPAAAHHTGVRSAPVGTGQASVSWVWFPAAQTCLHLWVGWGGWGGEAESLPRVWFYLLLAVTSV